jgi:peptidoglycan hydrolase-like protein with peptidoglycan-binding domain
VTESPKQDPLPPRSLAKGSSGPEVKELQGRLAQIWLYHGPMHGRYTSDVENAVANFQWQMNIDEEPKGVYGPVTRDALVGRTDEP